MAAPAGKRPGKAHTKGTPGQPHTKGRPAGPAGAKPNFSTPQPGRDVIPRGGRHNLWVNGGLDG